MPAERPAASRSNGGGAINHTARLGACPVQIQSMRSIGAPRRLLRQGSHRGLLHDAIEGQEVPRELIGRKFGENVAALVEEVSDDKELEKYHCKRISGGNRPQKSDDANRISGAAWRSARRCTAGPSAVLRYVAIDGLYVPALGFGHHHFNNCLGVIQPSAATSLRHDTCCSGLQATSKISQDTL
jgi:hypothetical protein